MLWYISTAPAVDIPVVEWHSKSSGKNSVYAIACPSYTAVEVEGDHALRP